MTYDARYFILHSLGADPKYAPTGSVLNIRELKQTPYHPAQPLSIITNQLYYVPYGCAGLYFVVASFRHTPPDSSVTHGGALRKDLSHLPLR